MNKKLITASLILALALGFNCKKEEDNDDETLALLLLAASQSGSSCTISNTVGGKTTSLSIPGTTASTSVTPVSIQVISNSNFGAVIARGLTAGQKVVFTNIGTFTPGVFRKSECNINFSTDSNAGVSNITSANAGGTTTFTVVTAGDYIFTVGVTGASVQIQ
jgi:hypothetical protein